MEGIPMDEIEDMAMREHVACELDEACALEHGHEGECADVLGLLQMMKDAVKSSFSDLKLAVRNTQRKYL
jgi:hypothetical protein